MDAKPKRKNTPDENTIEFVTALSVAECVARLKDAPSRTLDYRLNVRIDGARFVVESEAEVNQQGLRIVGESQGVLIHEAEKRTRVRAQYAIKYPVNAELMVFFFTAHGGWDWLLGRRVRGAVE